PTVTSSAAPGASASATGAPSSSVSGAPPGHPIEVNTVARLDPASGEVLDGYPVGANPGSLAVSGSAVWVANDDDRPISKIDLASGHVTTRGGVESPCGVFPAPGGAVWVTSCGQVIQLLDPRSLDVVRTLDVRNPGDVITASGSTWVVSNRGRFDPSFLYRFTLDGHLKAKIRLGLDSFSMAVSGDGTLWGNDHGDGT